MSEGAVSEAPFLPPITQGEARLVRAAVVADVACPARLLQTPRRPLHQDDQENREYEASLR